MVTKLKYPGSAVLPGEYQGLSTDTKPTDGVKDGSTFYELNTKKGWVFDSNNINPLTSDGWWEV